MTKLYVYTEELAAVLEEWIAQHDSQHEPRPNHNGYIKGNGRHLQVSNVMPETTAMVYLQERAQVPQRRLHAIRTIATARTTLEVADKILTTIGMHHKLITGEVRVVDEQGGAA